MNSPLYNQVNAILEQFGAHVGLDLCELDEDAGAQFALDDIFVSLLLDEDAGSLLMLSSIGHPEASAETYGRLLDANLFWSGANGATLARESASGSVVLQRALVVSSLDIERFETTLQSFVDTAEQLRGKLNETNGLTNADTSPDVQLPDYVVRG